MPKYRQTFVDMLKQNQQIFDDFKKVHDNYIEDPKVWKEQFDEQGRDIQDIIRRYENRLCGSSESSGHGRFTTELANKFHQEIKKVFPKIDYIGAE